MTNNTLRKQENAIVGITSCYYVILQVVILHDAIKAIQNGVFVFFSKKTKTCVFEKNGLKNSKKPGGLGFSKK